MKQPLQRAAIAAAVLAVITVGCKKEQSIHTYDAPRDNTAAPMADSGENSQNGARRVKSEVTAEETEIDLRWTLPASWKEVPVSTTTAFSPVIAEIQVSADQPELLLTVSKLPDSPGARSISGNVARWAGQLKMPAPSDAELSKFVTHIPIADAELDFVTLGGTTPDQPRLLAAILPHNHDTWVFKLSGERSAVENQSGAFADFLKSLRFEQAASPPVAGPPVPAPAATVAPTESGASGAGGAQWVLPAGWTADAAESNQFRVATIRPGNGSAQIKVSKLGAVGGGLGLNVSRWRGEVGLPPVDDAGADAGKQLKVGDQTWTLHDYTGPANGGTREIVALAETGDVTWYFKFAGPTDVIEKLKPDFDQFLTTIRLGN